ncbi:MAG: putative coenzyme synthesis protein [Bacteriovoracaceae bacterium]|nr:putative coenzyme synthesis protein [Bacteriovoracaceae bacterium]
MNFTESLKTKIESLHLLRHPFYQAWMAGELSKDQLRYYTDQYFPFVRAFPCFVSATHSLCEDLSARRYLTENLAEEEGFPTNSSHPELWLQFAAGLGLSSESVMSAKIGAKAKELAETFHNLCRSSYSEGLGALYAYEYQSPEVAKFKIEGLKKHFGISDEPTTAFFKVHETADLLHSETAARLLDQLSPEEQGLASKAAQRAGQALWDFLTEVDHESKKVCSLH